MNPLLLLLCLREYIIYPNKVPVKTNFVVIVQWLSCVQLFATPWTAAHQASLSFTISWSLFKLMSIELVMPSNHFIPLLLLPSNFPSIRVFSFTLGSQSIEASASASVLSVNIQDWFPLGLTGLISLQSKHKYKYLINMGKCSKGLIKWLILFSFLLEYNWFTMLY